MSLDIVLSGPRASEQQARTALASAGFEVQQIVDDHGLPAHPQGKTVKTPQAFVTVTADDDQLDAVVARAATLSWVLRMHHETPPPPEPSLDVQIAATFADMRREIDELQARVA